jgi:CRISPR-associated protein Csb2
MTHYLRLSFRLFDAVFHGRGDGAELEWPPSPLRAFQALVAAAGQRWRKAQLFDAYAREPLAWLAGLGSPDLIVPVGIPSSAAFRLYVPNNHADIVAAAWSGGDSLASIAEHRVEKDVRSTRLTGGDTIHYLWPVTSDRTEHGRVLAEIAREVSHLGWGIDQAAASLSIVTTTDVRGLVGERWIPTEHGGTLLRVPQPAGPTTAGTLADLRRKHADFLNRLGPKGFKPVPPLNSFAVVGYRRATDPASRPHAAFTILKPDASGNRSFDTPRRARDVAAWLRHVTGQVCEGWPFEPPVSFVHGHDQTGDRLKGETADRRFMFLPLPTINSKLQRVESVRRVLVVAPPGCQEQINWVRRRLAGQDLSDLDGEVVGLLNLLPTSDWVLRQYVEPARVWSTVTPVILPGHDDPDGLRKKLADRPSAAEQRNLLERLDRRVAGLLHRAFLQAGLPPELVNAIEALDWRRTGFRAGVDLADRYQRPDKLNGRQYHVRVSFPQPVAGPLAVGAGRYRGMGVFAADH